MRRFAMRIFWFVFREWRFFNLPTEKEEQILFRWKHVFDSVANALFKVLLGLAMFFEVRRRKESPRRMSGVFFEP